MFTSRLKLSTATGLLLALGLATLIPQIARGSDDPETQALQRWIFEPELALNLPQPLIVGVGARRPNDLRMRYFAETGFFRYPFIGGDRSVSELSLQGGARYSPFDGLPWFGSLALGFRSLGARVDMRNYTIDGVAPADQGSIGLFTIYAQIAVGAEWKVSNRLALGFDIGAQVPVIGWGGMEMINTTTGENSSNSATLAMDSAVAMGRLARLILPQVTLIRLTWIMP